MELIEVHILQSFPVSCLNRDDVGAPKTAVFGGVPRARVSSQCWKRAIRMQAQQSQPHAALLAAQRSRRWEQELAAVLEQRAVPEAAAAAALAIGYLASSEEAAKGAMVYLTRQQVEALAEGIATGQLEFAKSKQKGITCSKGKRDLPKLLGAVGDWADIAIFGRMVANDHSLTLEGAGLFSHALSTHRVTNEIDFFTAVDDLPTPEDADPSAGAAHMGTLEFSSACYYRYVGLNLSLLADEDHLAGFAPDQRKGVVDAFLRAAIQAVPPARHNSMFAHTLPQYVLALHRDAGQPLSLANAFEEPVWSPGGFVAKSQEAMDHHYAELRETYGLTGTEYRLPEVSFNAMVEGLVTHVR